jgi:hypothetical protein
MIPRRFRAVTLLLLSLAVPLLAMRAASAQTAPTVERAKESFKAGATAYAAGEYLAAIQALDAAYDLTPLPAIAFSLAQAERRQYFVGHDRVHLDRAIALYRRYIDQVPSGGRRADALDALSQLEPLAATLPRGEAQVASAAQESPSQPRGDTRGVRPTRVMITAEAPGAELVLDGGPPAGSPLIREVPPGKHRVQTRAAGFFPDEREVTAVVGELIPVVVALRERPSTIAVTSSVDAELYIDGAFVSRGGDRVALDMPSGSHRLSVGEKGHHPSIRVLDLRPGETQDLAVTLDETWQRRASRALFVGGGVALGAGIVLSVLAVGAEDRAQEFLRKQSAGNVSAAELADYHGAVTNRDRFRTATIVSVASAAGLLMTGLFLYEMDRTDPQELNRGLPPASGGSSRAGSTQTADAPRSHVQIAPTPLAGGLGAVLHATF